VFSTSAGTPLHGLSTFVVVTNPKLGDKGFSIFIVSVDTPAMPRPCGRRTAVPPRNLHGDTVHDRMSKVVDIALTRLVAANMN
jgi:hypothetical protein